MGREMIFEVRDNGKTIWPEEGQELYVCGRDDATAYMARLVETAMSKDNDAEPVLFLTCNDYEKFLEIKDKLKDYYNRDMAEIQKAKDTLEDLREARRHSTKLDDFEDFSNAMDGTEDWIKENEWSRAGHMMEYLDKCYNEMLELVNHDNNPDRQAVIERYKVAIIWSE